MSDAGHRFNQPAERELTGDVRRRIVEVINAELTAAVRRAQAQGASAEAIRRNLEARAHRLRSLYRPADVTDSGEA